MQLACAVPHRAVMVESTGAFVASDSERAIPAAQSEPAPSSALAEECSLDLTRRGFLKATTIGTAFALGFDVSEARAEMRELKIARTTETRSTCPYCSVSCGLIVHTLGDRAANAKSSIVYIEGDPEHPISRGTLCPKGATLRDDILSRQRVTVPKVRRPGSKAWEEISWDDAIAGIARHIKTTRDTHFVERNAQGQVVNRNPGMALVGGCTDTNEFNLLQWKAGASWGVVYRDSQARV
jgi:formate dehydrogenase major subunit